MTSTASRSSARAAFVLCLAVVAVLPACGADDGGAPAEAPIAEARAPLETSTCQPAALAWPGGATTPSASTVCAGAWKYQVKTPKRDASCSPPGSGPSECVGDHVACLPDWGHPIDAKLKLPAATVLLTVKPIGCQREGDAGETCMLNRAAALAACPSFTESARLAEAATIPDPWKDRTTAVVDNVTYDHPTWSGPPGPTRRQIGQVWKCTYHIEKPQPGAKQDPSCACATPLQYPECDVLDAPVYYSAPGLARQNLPPKTDTEHLSCLTCEGLPLPAAGASLAQQQAAAQARYACLASAANEPLDAAQRLPVRRAQLLTYEHYGHLLTDAQRAEAISFYGSDALVPSCGVTADLPAAPGACPSSIPSEGRATLLRCERLLSSHVPAAVASLALPACGALFERYAQLADDAHDTDCGGPRLRELAARLDHDLLEHQLGELRVDPSGRGLLARQLWLLDGWYRRATKNVELGVASAEAVRRTTSALLGELWAELRAARQVHKGLTQAAAAPSVSADDVEAALGLSIANGRAVDEEMVATLFNVPPRFVDGVQLERPPLAGLPLVALLGDALQPLVNDLDALVSFHDVACQFSDCRVPSLRTPTRSGWALVAGLGDASLAAQVADTRSALSGWTAVFGAVAARQAVLFAALDGTHAVPGAFVDQVENDVTPLARPLWRLLQVARARRDRFAATGLFEAAPDEVLHAGLLREQREKIPAEAAARVAAVGTAVTTYRAGIKTAVQEQLAAMENGASAQNLTDRRLKIAAVMKQKGLDVDGLRQSGDADARTMGTLTDAFLRVESAIDPNGFVAGPAEPPFQVSAKDARYRSGAPDPAALAVKHILGLAAGEMLVIDSKDFYTPTCVLTRTQFMHPTGQGDARADLSDARITTEGYTLGWNGSSYTASSKTSTHTTTTTFGVHASLCAKTGIAVEASACAYVDHSDSFSYADASSHGTEGRTSASFTSGLRLPGTPYPEYPVGALLAVVVDGATQAVRDVVIVRGGATQLLIEGPSDVHLVLNDAACAQASDREQVTVTVRRFVSRGAAARAAVNAMTRVLADLRARRAQYAAQGTLLPSQASLLRENAMNALQAELRQVDLAELPGPVAALFQAFVTHELVELERILQIQAIERDLELDLADLRALDADLGATSARGRLITLLPEWTLRDLDHDRLRSQLDGMLVVARDYLRPVIDLWYPGVLGRVAASPELQALLLADLDASLVTLADQAQKLVGKVLDEYALARLCEKAPPEVLPVVTVRFPRPGATVTGGSSLRSVDPQRAAQAWDAIERGETAIFEIRPGDFYSATGGSGVLATGELVPVVHHMELYAVSGDPAENDARNQDKWFLAGSAAASQTFVTPAGVRTYQLVDGAWRDLNLPLRFGMLGGVLDDPAAPTNPVRQQRGIGVSAAGSFSVDFSSLVPVRERLDGVTEIVVVMQIESRAARADDGASGGICR